MKVFFVHIMKTGGVSVKKYFQDNIPEYTHVQHSLADSSFISNEEMMEIIYSPVNTFKYYLDHRLSFLSTQPFDEPFTFTVVRNPIDRFISIYNYTNNKSHFFKNNISEYIHYAYIEQNVSSKVLSQLYHVSQGLGFNFLKDRLNYKKCLIIPFDYLNDIPEIFKIGQPFIHENITQNKIIEKPTKEIIDDFLPFIGSDLYFYNWCKNEYEKNRKELLKNGLPIKEY